MSEKVKEIVDALQWLINYYPKWYEAADPCECMRQAIEVLKSLDAELEQFRLKWISAEDATPKEQQDVLICVNGDTIDTGFCTYDDAGYPHWETYACMSNNVTHWMPLPGLPKEEE